MEKFRHSGKKVLVPLRPIPFFFGNERFFIPALSTTFLLYSDINLTCRKDGSFPGLTVKKSDAETHRPGKYLESEIPTILTGTLPNSTSGVFLICLTQNSGSFKINAQFQEADRDLVVPEHVLHMGQKRRRILPCQGND